MPPLAELQRAFRAAILAEDPARLAPEVVADGLAPERRIAVYRNNTFGTLIEALRKTFPVVCRLVDERFFAYAMHAFIAANPPLHGRLHAYGAGVPSFLETFEPARRVPYLADVARLEWAMAEAFHAADALPLEPAVLATVDLATIDGLRFVTHPTVRLIASRWPVDRIWEANQDGAPETAVQLDAGAARLVVQRPRLEVVYRALTPASFVFVRDLAAGRPLAFAAEAAAELESGFDLQSALLDHLIAGTFAGVAANSTSGESR